MIHEPVRVGVVGCGNISGVYLRNLQACQGVRLVACADLLPERAADAATRHGVGRSCTPDELLAASDVEVVLNLTVPKVHYEVARRALAAGKSVYNEKPLAVTRDEGAALVRLAQERGLRLGAAPDTFLGAGLQTARHALDAGTIGQPVAATAFMVCHGHEGWHPDPGFYYQVGGGPVVDMGPYYLTALVTLLGPVRRVCSSARITFPQRTIGSQPRRGEVIKVETPTHVAGVLDFANGTVVTLIMSFDVWHAHLPPLELHGSEASLSLPDPNGFDGPVRLRRPRDAQWQDLPLVSHYTADSRGLGVVDLGHALRSGRAHRANGALALHVLDVMVALHESSQRGGHVELQTTCARPAPLPTDLPLWTLDD